jgi:hypothetical protein
MVKRDEVEVQEKLTKILQKYNKRIGLKKMAEILFQNAEELEKASREVRAY